jgi:hypothetical protein
LAKSTNYECSFLHPPVTPSLFCPNILLNTLFSNTLSLCSSLNVKDQVSHPNRIARKVKPRRIGWAVIAAHVGTTTKSYRDPGRKFQGPKYISG